MAQVLPDALRVELGFGSSPLTGLTYVQWTDVTSSVMLSRGVQFSRGKEETDATARPGTASFTLDNSKQAGGEGRWTTKTGSWAGTAGWADGAVSWDGYALTTDGLDDETTGIGSAQPVPLRIPVRISATYPHTAKNLVSNPSFEFNTSEWSFGFSSPVPTLVLANDESVTITNRSATGSTSGLVTWGTGAANSQAVLTSVTTTIGRVYTASLWVYVPTGSPDVRAAAYFIADGPTVTAKDRWVRTSVTFTATATSTSVGLGLSSAATSGQVCYMDGVQCEAGSTMTAYTRGSPASISLWVGYVESVDTEWEDGYRPVVRIGASDRLARLQRKSLPSLILAEQLYDSPWGVWPLSDRSSSTFGNRSTQSGVSNLVVNTAGTGGTVTTGIDGSAPGPDELTGLTFALPRIDGASYLNATLNVSSFMPTSMSIECYFKPAAIGDEMTLLSLSNDSDWSYQLRMYISAAGKLCAATVNDLTIVTITGSTTLVAGNWYHAVLRQNADTYATILYLNGTNEGSQSTLLTGGLNRLMVACGRATTNGAIGGGYAGAISNVAVYQTVLTAARIAEHARARYTTTNDPGESSEDKFKRICRIASLPDADCTLQYGTSGATSATLNTFQVSGENTYSALDKVATTEAGAIYLNRSGQVVLASRDYRDAQSSQFNLPARCISSDTSLTLDMQSMVNDVTVSRPDGAEVRYVNTSSVALYDTHDVSIEIYSSTDAAVTEMAAWNSNVNAFPSQRVGDITVDLVTASLEVPVGALLAAEVGTWFKVTELPITTTPTGDVDLFIEGITDRVTATSWERSIVGSPASTSAVWILDDDALSILDETTVLGF